nr:NAD-dependent epimerase/dehydratase family protein [Candidatus Omnitrophota bacterium]
MDKASKIYVSGHSGMVGGAMVRQLQAKGYTNIVCKDSKQLDLRRQADVEDFFKSERPDYVLHFAARVGGIKANMSFPVEFLYDNALINMNVIYAAYKFNVKKLLYLGSSCVYPRLCPQPM